MSQIKTLTKEEVDFYFRYEEAEGKLFYKARGIPSFDAKCADKECSSIDTKGYLRAAVNCKTYLVHRIIYFIHTGEWPPLIDHKDTVKLNNKFSNLRKATYSENGLNRGLPKNNTSGVKGVTWNVGKNKWMARCSINGKRKHVGYFDDLDDAAVALDMFRKENLPEFNREK